MLPLHNLKQGGLRRLVSRLVSFRRPGFAPAFLNIWPRQPVRHDSPLVSNRHSHKRTRKPNSQRDAAIRVRASGSRVTFLGRGVAWWWPSARRPTYGRASPALESSSTPNAESQSRPVGTPFMTRGKDRSEGREGGDEATALAKPSSNRLVSWNKVPLVPCR